MNKIQKLIHKYDSNWFYCQCKSKYGNEVLYLLEEFVEDLKQLNRKVKKHETKRKA